MSVWPRELLTAAPRLFGGSQRFRFPALRALTVIGMGMSLEACTGDEQAELPATDDEPTEDEGEQDPACAEDSLDAQLLYWQVWETMDETYPYFDYKQIDWPALGAQCEAYVCAEGSGYNTFRDDAMGCLLGPLKDHHVAIVDRRDNLYQYGLPEVEGNSDAELMASLLDPGTATESTYSLTGTLMGGQYGYVRVDTWSGSALDGIDIAALVDQVGEVSGIVVDARSNGGGDPYIAAELAGRFTSDDATPYAYWQKRVEEDDDASTHELTDPEAFTLSAAAVNAEPFAGRVAVLLGPDCVSACESFAAMFDTLVPASRSFGATTRGASGWPVAVPLDDEKTVLYSSTVLTTLADSGLPIEWNGVPPDEFVEFGGDGRDEVLEAAITWLQAE